ncbi:MAG: baseplate J/gp47 family protein [Patescibacteria group bacterium]|jgi:hypothetical protein
MKKIKVQAAQQIQRHYTPLVIIFIGVTVLIGLLVYYLAFNKTTITIHTAPVAETQTFSYSNDQLDAVLVNTNLTAIEFTYSDISESTPVPSTARGTVVIENHYSADQPLVRTTRLLSTEDVLFRTDKTVVVPSGGSVTVPVYADEPGETGNIPPSKFEIVALWAGLKDKIYATSQAAMTGGVINESILTQNDMANAKLAAETAWREQASTALNKLAQTEATGITPDSLSINNLKQTTKPTSAGETASTITVTTSGTALALAFNQAKLLNVLAKEQPAVTFQADTLTYQVIPTDGTNGTVTGAITYTKTLQNSDIDKSKLTDKTKTQIIDYLRQQPGVQTVEVDLCPFWLSTIPDYWINKINITIEPT